MRICHISTVHAATDDRIFLKECRTLAQKENEVFFIVSNKEDKIVDGVHIIALPEMQGRFNRFFKKRHLALKKALNLNADIYHFHDPELIFTGIILKIRGKKVVYDVHEDVPLQILNKEWIGNMFFRKIVSFIFNLIEKFCARFFDGIVTVTDDIYRKFSFNKNAIILRNLPVLEIMDKVKPIQIKKEKFIMIYAGGLTKIRGIKEIIQAVGNLDGKAELWILGKWDSLEFEKECKETRGWGQTKYLGFKSVEEVYSYMKSADLGLCTLYPAKNHLNSWPVKALEYMACGLPMLMSDFPYWKETFNEEAVFVNPLSPEDISKKIKLFIENHEMCKNMGKNNRTLVESKYSWEIENKKLLDLYSSLVS